MCDVSFISVTLILPAAVPLLRPDGQMVILIKPQFEVGRARSARAASFATRLCTRPPATACDRPCEQFGFETEIIESPILGAEGNKEFLLYAHH